MFKEFLGFLRTEFNDDIRWGIIVKIKGLSVDICELCDIGNGNLSCFIFFNEFKKEV